MTKQNNKPSASKREALFRLILLNDENNFFHYVQEALVKIIGCTSSRAFELTFRAHYFGSTVIKIETLEEAMKHRDKLKNFGLNVEIENLDDTIEVA
jgi:ATP-dependent Clp protease adapter protein ClpS